jgi:hypothetical protein
LVARGCINTASHTMIRRLQRVMDGVPAAPDHTRTPPRFLPSPPASLRLPPGFFSWLLQRRPRVLRRAAKPPRSITVGTSKSLGEVDARRLPRLDLVVRGSAPVTRPHHAPVRREGTCLGSLPPAPHTVSGAARQRLKRRVIEAPWLVHGEHGASLKRTSECRGSLPPPPPGCGCRGCAVALASRPLMAAARLRLWRDARFLSLRSPAPPPWRAPP